MASELPTQHLAVRSSNSANDLKATDSLSSTVISEIHEVTRHSDEGQAPSIEDMQPIESARARFLKMIVGHFICDYVIEVTSKESAYSSHSELKRKSKEVHHEGDPRFALPLMYIANMYESLVNEVNQRLCFGAGDKTIGIALEASGGLYRAIAKKYPKKGTCTYRRRELATSLETRTRFPELVIQEEKRVRFVVVNGLDIVEKPTTMNNEDADWFKKLTGRDDVSVSASDYKFYSPRHKHRRNATFSPLPSSQSTPSKVHLHHRNQFQNPHTTPPQYNNSCVSPIANSDSVDYMHPMSGRLHLLPLTPAKFCDECGAKYLRETSKYCSECGAKRLGK